MYLDGVVKNLLDAFVSDPEVNSRYTGGTVLKTAAKDFPTGAILGSLDPAEGLSQGMSPEILLKADHLAPFFDKARHPVRRQGIIAPLSAPEEIVMIFRAHCLAVIIECLLNILVDQENVRLASFALFNRNAVAYFAVTQIFNFEFFQECLYTQTRVDADYK